MPRTLPDPRRTPAVSQFATFLVCAAAALLVARVPAAAPAPGEQGATTGGAASSSGFAARVGNAPHSGPVIRIGLTTDRRKVTISAGAGGGSAYRIVDPETGRPPWKDLYREEILVTTHGARPVEGRIWRVQVASLANRPEADALAAKLGRETGLETSVVFSPDRGSWRVRVGSSPSRDGLGDTITRMRGLGYTDAWASDEPAAGGEAWLRLVDSDYQTSALDIRRVRIEPADSGALRVDGRPYRGTLEVLVDASAGIRVIDELPLEEYLRGVVPSELGPIQWPELEALKAQAVAARTYAVRNLGRFAEEGFDLCDTPRCQVYDGLAAEHPLSDRAVRETAGIVATWNGEPINALYTSTCGGHTEDGGEIFPEEATPYLLGVDCYPEMETLRKQGIVIEGTAAVDAGEPPGEVLAGSRLLAARVITAGQLEQSWRDAPLRQKEARDLIEAAGSLVGVDGAIRQGRDVSRRLGFALGLSDRFSWKDRSEILVDDRDLPGLLPYTDLAAIPAAERREVASLATRGLLPAPVGGKLMPDDPLRRGEALRLLSRVMEIYEIPASGEGSLAAGFDAGRSGAGGGTHLRLRGSGGTREFDLAPPGRLALFVDTGGDPVPSPRVAIYAGDRVRYALGDRGEIRCLTILPRRRGLSDDRYSPAYSWEETLTAAELSRRLGGRVDIGNVSDITPLRRGVSGRVVSLRVTGSRGEATINGFNVRSALGIKENLFVIEKQHWADGSLRRVTLAGKGWGHGVGMCQVGAYGMAARGADYDRILKHYYTGISLDRLY